MHPLLAAAPLVLGLLLPPEEPRAASVRRGAEMAVAEAGAGVRLAVRGRSGAWGSDASEAARLVEDDGALALLAPPGGAATHLALQIAGRTGVPVAMLCADASVTAAAVPWAVRVAPSNGDEARAIFAAAPGRRWIAFVEPARAGREAASDLKRAAAGTGGATIVRAVEAGKPLPDVRTLLAAERPDGLGLLLWLEPSAAAAVAREARESGFAGTIAGPARLDAPEFRTATSVDVDLLVPRFAADAAFARRYRERYGSEPDLASALAHDGAALLIDLLRRSGAREARTAFPPAGSFAGATGTLTFDRSGNRIVKLEPRLLSARGGRS